ncbi:membrane protein [Polynucleobacter sp. SHI8]|uniref:DUF924 family protein n=1 Tax=unclassified Polynucleobacter TaxID=2640945 RepID=UPI0024902DE6|nr:MULTISPECIES: DUF924 family protein [unclassified Polynucleobacter]BDW10729.1 membrane protein [Polynucleobacter sp. SHI2]BDW13175.1 membrane protein [Polynucleobacter sp. SHI8]
MTTSFEAIIKFWFVEISPKQWWEKSIEFDQMVLHRFAEIHRKANQCELFEWRKEPLGRLAEIIILDQFSRNMYRDTPSSFASDPLALALTQMALEQHAEEGLSPDQKGLLFMPMMHSESLLIHQYSQAYFAQAGCESYANSQQRHQNIIERFGRYPHRNKILGRESTPTELEFLKQPGSSF